MLHSICMDKNNLKSIIFFFLLVSTSCYSWRILRHTVVKITGHRNQIEGEYERVSVSSYYKHYLAKRVKNVFSR